MSIFLCDFCGRTHDSDTDGFETAMVQSVTGSRYFDMSEDCAADFDTEREAEMVDLRNEDFQNEVRWGYI